MARRRGSRGDGGMDTTRAPRNPKELRSLGTVNAAYRGAQRTQIFSPLACVLVAGRGSTVWPADASSSRPSTLDTPLQRGTPSFRWHAQLAPTWASHSHARASLRAGEGGRRGARHAHPRCRPGIGPCPIRRAHTVPKPRQDQPRAGACERHEDVCAVEEMVWWAQVHEVCIALE